MKKFVTATLLLFVVVSIGILIGKEMGTRTTSNSVAVGNSASTATVDSGPRVIAYYFHGQTRCATCKTIEAYAHEAIETHFADDVNSGRLEVRWVNFDEPGNEHFLDDYELASSSLVLVDPHSNGPGSWKLLQDVWQLTDDKPAFLSYVHAELGGFLASHGG